MFLSFLNHDSCINQNVTDSSLIKFSGKNFSKKNFTKNVKIIFNTYSNKYLGKFILTWEFYVHLLVRTVTYVRCIKMLFLTTNLVISARPRCGD